VSERNVKLGVVSIEVKRNRRIRKNLTEWTSVKREKKRPEDRSLRDTSVN
jgi:hypothetical protein